MFPLRVAYPCQLLPHVNGVTVSEYYELIRPPKAIGYPTCRFGYAYLSPVWWTKPMHNGAGTIRVSQACPEPVEGFLTLLSTHATLFVDPGRPSESSPMCFLCVGFWAVKTIAICIWAIFIADAINGAVSSFREYGFPCGLCGSLCTLQLSCSAFASVTTATLGMNGWLGLVHQGLSPWKKRQALLGALTVCVTGRWGGRGLCLGAGKTRSQKNACKPHRISSVQCTLCWADV